MPADVFFGCSYGDEKRSTQKYPQGFLIYTNASEDGTGKGLDQLLLMNNFLIDEPRCNFDQGLVYMVKEKENERGVVRYYPLTSVDKNYFHIGDLFKTRIDFFGDTSSVEDVVNILKNAGYKVLDPDGNEFKL